MDSTYLLVIDNSPDHAQVINSFLRNAGVAVRVVNASSFSELEDALLEKAPFLILIGTQLPASAKIGQIMQLADQFSTPVTLQLMPGDTSNIEDAIADYPLLIINAEENDQLMQVVKQHMSGGNSAREYNQLTDTICCSTAPVIPSLISTKACIFMATAPISSCYR